MGESAGLTAWLHTFDAPGPLSLQAIREELQSAGVRTVPLNHNSPLGLGIVVCNQVSDEICDFIRRFSRQGLDPLLALTRKEQATAGGVGALLDAGALDVLKWDDLESPAALIAA